MEDKKPYRIEGRPQTIYRVVKSANNPYVMIDRRPIDNPKLSFKAKGILTYLMSRPDGWEVSVADLINHAPDGEASVRAGMKELKLLGHVKYTKMRNAGRITGWLIEVYEIPHSDFQDVVFQDVENRTQVLSTLSNKKLNNKTTTTTAAPKKSNAFALYESNIGPLTPIISDTIKDMEQTYTEAWVLRAIQEAVTSNVRNLKYIGGILAGYKERGSPDIGRTKISNTRPSAPKKETTEEILRRMAVDAYNRR